MTLHIMEEVNYLSTITYTTFPSVQYAIRCFNDYAGGGLRLSFVSSKGVKFMTLEKQCKGEMRSG